MYIFFAHRFHFRFVDPNGRRDVWRSRAFFYKPFWMRLVCGVEDFASGFLGGFRKTVMDSFRGEQADTGMVMFDVIPGKEILAEASAILDATEALGEIWPVLEGLELGLGEWLVIARVGRAMGLGDPQIGQEQGHGPGPHGRAPVRMNGQLAAPDILLCTGSGALCGAGPSPGSLGSS